MKRNRAEPRKENCSVNEIKRKNAYDAGLKQEREKTGGNEKKENTYQGHMRGPKKGGIHCDYDNYVTG